MCIRDRGAPIGSVLVGNAAFIASAKRWRKMLGGGLRQSGIIAAAGIYALRHHRDRLVEDHEMALRISEAMASVPGVDVVGVNTNMVFSNFANFEGDAQQALTSANILADVGAESSRFVTHLDLPNDAPERLHEALTR